MKELGYFFSGAVVAWLDEAIMLRSTGPGKEASHPMPIYFCKSCTLNAHERLF